MTVGRNPVCNMFGCDGSSGLNFEMTPASFFPPMFCSVTLPSDSKGSVIRLSFRLPSS